VKGAAAMRASLEVRFPLRYLNHARKAWDYQGLGGLSLFKSRREKLSDKQLEGPTALVCADTRDLLIVLHSLSSRL